MRTFFVVLAAAVAAACSGPTETINGENLSAPVEWVPLSSGIPEPSDEPTTPACGHECPGSPLTLVFRETCGSWTATDGGAALAWNGCTASAPYKQCFCLNPLLPAPADAGPLGVHAGEIVFDVSADEARCSETLAFWREQCPSPGR